MFLGKSAAIAVPCPSQAAEEDVPVGRSRAGMLRLPGVVEDLILGYRGQNSKVFLPKGEAGAGAAPWEHKHIPKEEMGGNAVKKSQ